MPQKIQKPNIKLILKRNDAGMPCSKIALARHMPEDSVADVIRIANEHEITYNDVWELDGESVHRMFYPNCSEVAICKEPDYAYVHQNFQCNGVTLWLLWREYQEKCKSAGSISMGYSKFCSGYRGFTIMNKLENPLEHKPGAVIEVILSATAISYTDIVTGETVPVYLFAAMLPYSQYSYVEPCLDGRMDSFLRCHIRMYQYFGGATTWLVCNKLKTGTVTYSRDRKRLCLKEGKVALTVEYELLGEHYKTAIVSSVLTNGKITHGMGTVREVAALIASKLQNQKFYNFSDLKAAVLEQLNEYNYEHCPERDVSRYALFLEEKTALQVLPDIPFEFAKWIYNSKVGLDCHVKVEKNRFSCPYKYAREPVDLRITRSAVEIYFGSVRLTTHNIIKGSLKRYYTHVEDMPGKVKLFSWDDISIKIWASSIGKYTAEVINRIFNNVEVKEQGYYSALAVLNLSKKYSETRLEAACKFAIENGIEKLGFNTISHILTTNQDGLSLIKNNAEDGKNVTIAQSEN